MILVVVRPVWLILNRIAENERAPAQKLNVVTYDTSEQARYPGKWLEWIHIKITGGMQVCEFYCHARSRHKKNLFSDRVSDERTEWHQLQAKSPSSHVDLRDRLCAMLDLFPSWNRWQEMGYSDDATVSFENLVDSTWSRLHDESIAYFIY